MRLTALDEAAEAIGLKKNQGVAEARAICPMLDVIEEDSGADRRLLDGIADWCDRYTPLVALDGRDGLFLDITGCAHLFGGEKELLKDILSLLFQMGIDARGAISPAPGLSWATSRFGSGGVIADEEVEHVLSPLPVAALRLQEETVAALQKLGLKQVGDLLLAPRAPLARRFGAHLLLRLDQALGRNEEPVSPRRAVASLSAERRLSDPIQSEEDILYLTGQIALSLKASLEERGAGGRAFELVLFRVDGRVFRIAAGASHPLRDPKRIAALFSERLQAVHDDLDAGYGFEILRLNVMRHEAFDAAQEDFDGDRQKDVCLASFVDRVSARLGADCLQSFQLHESHVPERAVTAAPAIRTLSSSGKKPEASGFSWSRSERPLRLFIRPESVEVSLAEVPEGPPESFRWRRMLHRISRSQGPERLGMEWWIDGADARARDYFRVEDDTGHRFWIFREGLYGQMPPPRWFMHGVFA
jgi:protein ImuB